MPRKRPGIDTKEEDMSKIEQYIVSIPVSQEKGIIFRDITSALGNADGLRCGR